MCQVSCVRVPTHERRKREQEKIANAIISPLHRPIDHFFTPLDHAGSFCVCTSPLTKTIFKIYDYFLSIKVQYVMCMIACACPFAFART